MILGGLKLGVSDVHLYDGNSDHGTSNTHLGLCTASGYVYIASTKSGGCLRMALRGNVQRYLAHKNPPPRRTLQ